MSELGDLLDGFSLWQEHRPRTPEDWRAIARTYITEGLDASDASPEFAALLWAERHLQDCAERMVAKSEAIRRGEA